MTAVPRASGNTVALFASSSRNSERAIIPINDSALDKKAPSPAFYCIHSVSGTVRTDFLELAGRLEPHVRFYGIQAPPKQIQDPSFGASIEAIADHYADALAEFQPQGPLVLGGYCAGAVVALEMAINLRARGREVGPLIAIDGAPENSGAPLSHWKARYWLDVARNLPDWAAHGDLMRNASWAAWVRSVVKNVAAVARGAMSLKPGQRLGGGYAMDDLMDLSPYSPAHRLFINRFFAALFDYVPQKYPHEVVVYEAKVTSLLYLPQYARAWREVAPKADIVRIVGTHIAMMHEPYVEEIARDIRERIAKVFPRNPTSGTGPAAYPPRP